MTTTEATEAPPAPEKQPERLTPPKPMKPIPLRLPEDWKVRLRETCGLKYVAKALGLSGSGRGMVTFIRAVLKPILNGSLRPIFKDGEVVGFREVETRRRPVSDPPPEGRPRVRPASDDEPGE